MRGHVPSQMSGVGDKNDFFFNLANFYVQGNMTSHVEIQNERIPIPYFKTILVMKKKNWYMSAFPKKVVMKMHALVRSYPSSRPVGISIDIYLLELF